MYYIRVNKKQLQIIAEALDLHSRVISGDLGEAVDVFSQKNFPDFDETYVRMHMDAVCKEVARLPLNANYGIFSKQTHEDAKIGYEIYKAIMNRFYYEQKEPRTYSVHSRIVDNLTTQPKVLIQKTFEVLRRRLKRAKNNN